MTEETQSKDTSAAVTAGIEQALAAAVPAIATVAAAADPKLQLALVVIQALGPALTELVAQFNNQQMTKEELDTKMVALKAEAATAHNEWLQSIQVIHE